MGSLANQQENDLLDHVFNSGYSHTDIYVGLSTADPLDDASGLAEPSGNNYARVEVNDAAWNAASSRAITNNGAITFPKASGAWGTVTHYVIWNHASNTAEANLIGSGTLDVAKDIVNNNTPEIADEDISISFSAGDISDYAAEAWLNLVFRNTPWSTPAANIHIGLSTVDPTDDGSGISEPGDTYARQNETGWPAASGGTLDNDSAITFPTAGASWGTLTHMIIMDAITDGNMLFYDTIENQEPTSGDIVKFSAGDLDVTIT